MAQTRLTDLLLIALWLIPSLSGCATSGDLEKLKQELQQSIVEKAAPIEPLKAGTKAKFDALQNDIDKVTQQLNGFRETVSDLTVKANNLVQDREKVYVALQAATGRVVDLFKVEESQLKERIRFLHEAIKNFEAEGAAKK